MNNLWTIREAAAIAGIPVKAFRLMIEREGTRPEPAQDGRQRTGRLVSMRDLVYIKLLAEFPFSLEKSQKTAIEDLLRGRRPKPWCGGGDWQADGQEIVLQTGNLAVRVDCSHVRETLAKNAAAFDWGQRRIVSDYAVLNGEPIFRGTRTALARVEAAIRNGATDSDLASQFPELSETDLDYARIHARLGKRPGRPRKARKTIDTEQSAQAA